MRSYTDLTVDLPVLQRLALSYAPKSAREATFALFALDARLAGIVRTSREPMLGQLRLAWWRERLQSCPTTWPEGEPVLTLLRASRLELEALAGLVDGWEELTREAPLPGTALNRLATARGAAFGALAVSLGKPDEGADAALLGEEWALADIAVHVSHVKERQAAADLVASRPWQRRPLSRALRSLTVLHGLAARAARRGENLDALSPGAIIPAIRLGLLGR